MKITVQGLGRMGLQIARKLTEGNHEVLALNRSQGPVDEAVHYGAIAAISKQAVAKAYGDSPVIIWIMLPAEIVEAQLSEWMGLLPKGSILIDGGNSDFRNTTRHSTSVTAKGLKFVDVGVSGGVWGYRNGFSMMVGSDAADA